MKNFKVAAIIGMLLGATSAIAQVAAPQAPQPPAIVTVSPNASDANQISTTNKVYIDQAGQNVNINIEQTGTSNEVGNVSDPIYLRGDNQTGIVIQTGNSNKVYMTVMSDTGSAGDADFTIRQIGNLNEAEIRCGEGTSADCNDLDLNMRFTGNSNEVIFTGAGTNIRSSVDTSGNYNTFNIDALSPNATQTLKFVGDYNTINIAQTDAGGAFGHSLWIDSTGSSNAFTTQQYGASETVINILSVGSNGTFNIKTGH